MSNESSNKTGSAAQLKACQKILDAGSCTCNALAKGELAKCGLADPKNFPSQ